jgi:hypothetical protein
MKKLTEWLRLVALGRYSLAQSPSDRLASVLEGTAEEKRVSEGDPENWAAAARLTSGSVGQPGWRQREPAQSQVSLGIRGGALLGWFIGGRACK